MELIRGNVTIEKVHSALRVLLASGEQAHLELPQHLGLSCYSADLVYVYRACLVSDTKSSARR